MKAVIFGTGAIGGGVIVPLVNDLGWEPIVIARNPQRAQELGSKPLSVRIATRDHEEEKSYKLDTVISEDNREAVLNAFLDGGVGLVFTAVKQENLKAVAQVLAPALSERWKSGLDPVYLLPFENVSGNGKVMRNLIGNYGFREVLHSSSVVIDCMAYRNGDGVIVREPFREIVVERVAALDTFLTSGRVSIVKNAQPFHNRKICLVSGIHTAIALEGLYRGYEYVNQAALDSIIQEQLEAVIREMSVAICCETHFVAEDMVQYGQGTILRASNPHLPDRCSKFLRRIPGKLSPSERFGKPAIDYLRRTNGIPPALCRILALGFVLAEQEEKTNCQDVLSLFPELLYKQIMQSAETLMTGIRE